MLLRNVNVGERPHLFRVFDFLPCISHDKLLKVLFELIFFLFKEGNGQFIFVDSHGTKLAIERLGFVFFTKSNLKNAVKNLLRNCYVKLANKIFRIIIGISVV